MADVRPFNAYRPKKGMEIVIAELPYDVYNRAESVEIVKENPESFLAIDRAENQFSDDVDTYDPRVYAKAADMIRERIADARGEDRKPTTTPAAAASTSATSAAPAAQAAPRWSPQPLLSDLPPEKAILIVNTRRENPSAR